MEIMAFATATSLSKKTNNLSQINQTDFACSGPSLSPKIIERQPYDLALDSKPAKITTHDVDEKSPRQRKRA